MVYAWLQRTEVVLTAHPTQVNRRTLQHKHCRIAALLAQNDRHIYLFPSPATRMILKDLKNKYMHGCQVLHSPEALHRTIV